MKLQFNGIDLGNDNLFNQILWVFHDREIKISEAIYRER